MKFLKKILKQFQNVRFFNKNFCVDKAEVLKEYKNQLKGGDDVKSNWIYVENYERLPKLPVPPLEETIKKYEEKMKIFLNKDEYINLKQLTKTFVEDENLGPRLQKFLIDRREKLDNWAYDYWLDDMYLNARTPLPIYSSPGYVYATDTHFEDICNLGAHIIYFAVMMQSLIKLNIFPREKNFNQNTCMDQYNFLFNSTRLPGKEKDTTLQDSSDNKHVIIIYQNNFYYVPIKFSENGVDISAMYSNLKSIKSNLKEYNKFPVGTLTTLGRREWWEIRETLLKNSVNKSNLKLIDSALCILCIDQPLVESCDNNQTVFLKQMLHGGSIYENGCNRWYDKTLQIILSESHLGLCFEHTLIDGVVITTAMESIFNSALQMPYSNSCHYSEMNVDYVRLNWFLGHNVLQSISHATLQFDNLIQDLDLQVWTFDKYGSQFIKSHKCSPDGYVQLILQLTYYKLNGKLCVTYESGSTRKFKKGRVDCIRPTTPEAFEWVKQMVKSNTDTDLKLQLWIEALDAQYKESKNVTLGHGIDIHLLGLKNAGREILGTTPKLFDDKSYTIANKFRVSTSQVGTKDVWGFGPVINDGYGVFYCIKSDTIKFMVSSLYSCRTTSTKKFLNALEESLGLVKTLIEKQ